MKNDYSCGVIPFRRRGGRIEFLLVQHLAGHWAFPKGHPEDDETSVQTARREFSEETGIAEVDLISMPEFNESYKFTKRSGKRVLKRVSYFLGEVSSDAEVMIQENEIANHQWAEAEATRKRISFIEGQELFDRAWAYFEKHLGDAV